MMSFRAVSRWQKVVGVCAIAGFALSVAASARGDEGAAGREEDAVLSIVQQFFDVLESRDVEAGAGLVAPEVRFFSTREKDGESVVRTSGRDEFLASLASGEEALLERMWDPEVRIRGRIAMVWTLYDFHRDGEFSHCGVDAFSLVKTEAGWQIVSCIYTVEPAGCPANPGGPPLD
jgi:hypothetical protein